MNTLLIGSFLLSIFHALIPSHWLPVLAIGKQEGWSKRQTLWITFLTGMAHVLSTVLLGIVLAAIGSLIAHRVEVFTRWLAPGLLLLLGAYYVYQHYRHHHFHLHRQNSRFGVIGTLILAMFLSPCLEIESYFLTAGQYGPAFVALLALVYAIVTVCGMMVWMSLALRGLQRLDWHAWEHYAGLITGATLILSGISLFWLD